MSNKKRYDNPGLFKNAFKRNFQSRPDQELVVLMQRFAARVCQTIEGAVVKGGLGLELRLYTPRTTKDADIIIAGSHDLDARLRTAGAVDLDDFLRFQVTPESGFDVAGMLYPRKTIRSEGAICQWPWPLV